MASKLDDLVEQILAAARADASTRWYQVVTEDQLSFVEDYLDLTMPRLLKACYTRISNGGFGPGFHVTGLPGGHESSWGDLIQTTDLLRRHDEYDDQWLPLIDWGCAEFTIVDCSDRHIVTLYDGNFHDEDYGLTTLFKEWLDGNSPCLSDGTFQKSE